MAVSAIDLTSLETVEVATKSGFARTPGHRYGDFAVTRQRSGELFSPWNITHLPTGRAIASDFRAVEGACEAMVDIAKLRNDWAVLDDETLNRCSEELRPKVIEIAEANGGRVRGRSDGKPREPVLNGYAEFPFQ